MELEQENNSISVSKALNSSKKFWWDFNGPEGFPEDYPEEDVIRFVKRHKKSGGAMLDLGSGSGKNLLVMAEHGFDVTGLDWSQPGLDYTQKKLSDAGLRAKLVTHDFSDGNLPFQEAVFDYVVAMQVFDHVLDSTAKNLMKTVRQTLKPSGILFASFMTPGTTKKSRTGLHIDGELRADLVSSGNSAGEIHRFLDRAQIEELISGGFEVLSSHVATVLDELGGEVAEARYMNLRKI